MTPMGRALGEHLVRLSGPLLTHLSILFFERLGPDTNPKPNSKGEAKVVTWRATVQLLHQKTAMLNQTLVLLCVCLFLLG